MLEIHQYLGHLVKVNGETLVLVQQDNVSNSCYAHPMEMDGETPGLEHQDVGNSFYKTYIAGVVRLCCRNQNDVRFPSDLTQALLCAQPHYVVENYPGNPSPPLYYMEVDCNAAVILE